jgi:hypothetical protein
VKSKFIFYILYDLVITFGNYKKAPLLLSPKGELNEYNHNCPGGDFSNPFEISI